FSLRHHAYEKGETFYHSRVVPMDHGGRRGTDMLVSFVDYAFNPLSSPSQTVYADVLCTNRGITDQIKDNTIFSTEGENLAGYQIRCLDKPTLQADPDLDGQTQWKLISHLALNQLSLENGEEGLARLREILKLHFRNADQESELAGITSFSTQSTAHRLGTDAWRGFVQGTEVNVGLSATAFTGSSAFLFSHVLSRFLNQYANINSFVQLVAHKSNRTGEWIRWPALKGNRPLL
ncbi:type VI secretion system baseplate subunit TssF, partial [Alphaproteobacteria bacterium]|nr:type VI secretion system baseplate subunit TssF [Alphaproteobacteria bacterium]